MSQRKALSLGHQHGDQLAPARHQGGEFALLLIEQCTRLVALCVEQGGKVAQGLRVDAVGLGQLAHAACEVPCLARIDHRHAQARRSLRKRQVLLMAAGGLHQDQPWRQRYQHLAQLGMAGLVVAQAQGLRLPLAATSKLALATSMPT